LQAAEEAAAATAAAIERAATTDPPVQYEGPNSEDAAAAAGDSAAAKLIEAFAEEDASDRGGPRVAYPDALVAQAIVQHLKQQQAGVAARRKYAAHVPPELKREVRSLPKVLRRHARLFYNQPLTSIFLT
jgi:hypothetical protein